MPDKYTMKFVAALALIGLSSFLFAQEDAASQQNPEAANPEDDLEPFQQEDKAYTSYAICAGFYAVMVDEFRAMPQEPEVDYTIEAYLEAGEVSTMLASAFASIDYSSESIQRIVADAINRETETLRAMVKGDIQLVGTLYDMICERMIDEAFTVLAG